MNNEKCKYKKIIMLCNRSGLTVFLLKLAEETISKESGLTV